MASNRGTGPLKLSEKKWLRPLEIVIDGSEKDDPPVRNKLSLEVEISEWLYMKGLEK